MAALKLPVSPTQSHSFTGALETNFGRSERDSNPLFLPALDRYRLSCLLGRGGMAEVFLAAWQVAPQVVRPVVVKRLYSHFSDEQPLVRMFIDEARLVCQLDHEHIVKTYEIGLIDGHLCIVMEYLEGQTLQQLIRGTSDSTTLPIQLAAYIAAGVLNGLKHAHESHDCLGNPNEIVHRDISPQNVFITNSGQVKILDFGIAKAKSHESRTSTGIVKGKFAYIAPEQASGYAVDGRADLFSLGVVLWEALAGKRLFKADGDAATLNATLKREVPFLTSIRPEIPLDVAIMVNRALQRNPKERYASATAMLADVEKYLGRLAQRPNADSLSKHMHACFANEIKLQQQRVRDLMVLHQANNQRNKEESQPPSSGRTIVDGREGSIESVPSLVPAAPSQTRIGQHVLTATLAGLAAALALVCLLLWLNRGSHATSEQRQSKSTASSRVLDLATKLDAAPVSLPQAQPLPAQSSSEGLVAATPAVAQISNSAVSDKARIGNVLAIPIAASAGKRKIRNPDRVKVDDSAAGPLAMAPPTEVQTIEAPATSAPVEYGSLTLDTTPWSLVSVKGKPLGTTPIIQTKLPVGTHVLSLRNPELGLETQYSVTIKPNQTVTRRIGLK